MQLQSLTVKALGPFKEAYRFELAPLTIFYGQNYVGKSTLARAIYYAVTGKPPFTGTKAELLASLGTERGTVGLHFKEGADAFRLYRSTKGDVLIERRLQDAWSPCGKTEAILPPLNAHQWKVGSFLLEDELGEFLTQTPADRRDLVNQLLGVDTLLAVRDALIKARKFAKRQEKEVNIVVDRLEKEQGSGLSDPTAELENMRSSVSSLEARLSSLGNPDRSVAGARAAWEEAARVSQGRAEKAEVQLEALRQGAATRAELEATIGSLRAALASREAVSSLKKSCYEKRLALDSERHQLERTLAAIRGLNQHESCPTCEQHLPAGLVESLADKYRDLLAATLAQLDQVKLEEEAANAEHARLAESEQALVTIELRHERWRQLEDEIAVALNEVEQWKQKLATVSTTEDIEAETLNRTLAERRQALIELERQHAHFLQRRQALADAIAQARQAERARIHAEWATAAGEETVKRLIGMPLQDAEEAIIADLHRLGLFDGRLGPIDLAGSSLKPSVAGLPMNALSGSERALLYLTMKFALSKLWKDPGFIVLDEPTTHLDADRQRLLASYLEQVAEERQVIIFTNNRAFTSYSDQAHVIETPAHSTGLSP